MEIDNDSDVMNMTLHRVYQTGEGERGRDGAAIDLGRLRIRLSRRLLHSDWMRSNNDHSKISPVAGGKQGQINGDEPSTNWPGVRN